MKPTLFLMFSLLLLCSLFACQENSEPIKPDIPYQLVAPETPIAKGDRLFGINISESSKGFDASFATAQEAGVQVVELNLPWNILELDEGQYDNPWNVLTDVAFYGEHNVQVLLSLAVINTVERTTPDYLNGSAYDDPHVIAAFNNLVDWVMITVPENVTIVGIGIGNEIDLVLNDDDWERYIRFYEATVAHIQRNYPNTKVGTKVTVMKGVKEEIDWVQKINEVSDVIMLNYYPQDAQFKVLPPEIVHEHLAQIVANFPDREIWFTEVGYQSGNEYCDSSEAKQALFFHELFAAWDNHQEQLKLILVDWLHDQSAQQIEEFEAYYGFSDPGFVEYLSTLGLRNYNHTDKAAWRQVLAETQSRGWVE